MLSVVYKGKVLDFSYKKSKWNTMYTFYIGDILLGQIFRQGKHNWHGVCFYEGVKGSMGGFGSRYHASEYLIEKCGFGPEEKCGFGTEMVDDILLKERDKLLQILRDYPKGQDDGSWIKRRALALGI